jgi:hypothetical protein
MWKVFELELKLHLTEIHQKITFTCTINNHIQMRIQGGEFFYRLDRTVNKFILEYTDYGVYFIQYRIFLYIKYFYYLSVLLQTCQQKLQCLITSWKKR